MTINPYAAPKASLESAAPNACWPMGKSEVYVSRSGDLPARCVKCNAPAMQPVKKRTLYWHSSGWYLLILVNIVIYAIAALAVRKKIQVSPGLCAEHSKKRNRLLYGSLSACAISTLAGLLLIDNGTPALVVAAFAIALISLIVAAVGTRTVHPTEINERGARLKGCGKAFLDSLRATDAQEAAISVPRSEPTRT